MLKRLRSRPTYANGGRDGMDLSRLARSAKLGRRALVLVVVGAVVVPAAAQGQAVITNGTVSRGVDNAAQLNIPGPPSAQGTGAVGVRFVSTNNEGTAAGCLCEGWGAADATSGATGWANNNEGGIRGGLTPI